MKIIIKQKRKYHDFDVLGTGDIFMCSKSDSAIFIKTNCSNVDNHTAAVNLTNGTKFKYKDINALGDLYKVDATLMVD